MKLSDDDYKIVESDDNDILHEFEQNIGYKFVNIKLLAQAVNQIDKEYRKLAFVGDRVLGLAVADLLNEQNPNDGAGDLTEKSKHMVKNNNGELSRVARKFQLHKYIISERNKQYNSYQSTTKSAEYLFASAMEAVIGAMFIDSGRNYNIIKAFIMIHWQKFNKNIAFIAIESIWHLDLNMFEAILKVGLNPNLSFPYDSEMGYSQEIQNNAKYEFGNSTLIGQILSITLVPREQARIRVRMLEKVIEAGADINLLTEGCPPLILAVINANYDSENGIDYKEVIDLLMRNKVNLNQPDCLGNTALHEVVGLGNIDLIKRLFKNTFINNPTLKMFYNSIDEMREVESIFREQFDYINLDVVNQKGLTPLHIAVQKNRYDMVRFLIEHGADVNIKNVQSETVLHYASYGYASKDIPYHVTQADSINYSQRYSSIIKLLLENGADTRINNNKGNTAIDIIRLRGEDQYRLYRSAELKADLVADDKLSLELLLSAHKKQLLSEYGNNNERQEDSHEVSKCIVC